MEKSLSLEWVLFFSLLMLRYYWPKRDSYIMLKSYLWFSFILFLFLHKKLDKKKILGKVLCFCSVATSQGETGLQIYTSFLFWEVDFVIFLGSIVLTVTDLLLLIPPFVAPLADCLGENERPIPTFNDEACDFYHRWCNITAVTFSITINGQRPNNSRTCV